MSTWKSTTKCIANGTGPELSVVPRDRRPRSVVDRQASGAEGRSLSAPNPVSLPGICEIGILPANFLKTSLMRPRGNCVRICAQQRHSQQRWRSDRTGQLVSAGSFRISARVTSITAVTFCPTRNRVINRSQQRSRVGCHKKGFGTECRCALFWCKGHLAALSAEARPNLDHRQKTLVAVSGSPAGAEGNQLQRH